MENMYFQPPCKETDFNQSKFGGVYCSACLNPDYTSQLVRIFMDAQQRRWYFYTKNLLQRKKKKVYFPPHTLLESRYNFSSQFPLQNSVGATWFRVHLSSLVLRTSTITTTFHMKFMLFYNVILFSDIQWFETPSLIDVTFPIPTYARFSLLLIFNIR